MDGFVMHMFYNEFLYIYLNEFSKTWLKKFQMHFNDLTSKSNWKRRESITF